MSEAAAQRLHLALTCVAVALLVALTALVIPRPSPSDESADKMLSDAQADHDAALSVRHAAVPWIGAGLAIGAGIGGVGTLLLWRRQQRRLEEGR